MIIPQDGQSAVGRTYSCSISSFSSFTLSDAITFNCVCLITTNNSPLKHVSSNHVEPHDLNNN